MTIQGSHVAGKNVTIEAKDDVNILAAQDTQNTTGSNKSSGGSIGVTIGLTTGQTSVGVSINGGKGKNRGDGVENIESTIDARDTLTIISGGDTNIIGSQVKGDTVKAEIEGDLNIVSLQDTANSKDSQTNWSVSGSTTGAVSGSYSNQKFGSNYKSVDEQAGIFAGSGGFDITVGGNANLVGGVIVSTADPKDNKIEADTVTFIDIKNTSEYDSSTTGVNFNSGPGVANKDKGMTPNFGGSSDKETSTTKSGISEGTIIIRDEDKQKQDVADLNRNPDGKNQALEKPPEKEIVFEKEQAAAIAGEIGFTIAGDIIQKNKWDQDDPRSIALHGVIGGIVAEIGDGNFGEGMTTAAINKLVIVKLGEMKDKEGKPIFDGDELRWISAGLGNLIIGNQGAGIADSATKNNFNAYTAAISFAPYRSETTLKILVGEGSIVDIPMTAGSAFVITAYPDKNGDIHVWLSPPLLNGSLGVSVYPADYSGGTIWGWGGDEAALDKLGGISNSSTIMAGAYFKYTNSGWISIPTLEIGMGTNAKYEVGATYSVYLGSSVGLLYEVRKSLIENNVNTKSIDDLIRKLEGK